MSNRAMPLVESEVSFLQSGTRSSMKNLHEETLRKYIYKIMHLTPCQKCREVFLRKNAFRGKLGISVTAHLLIMLRVTWHLMLTM